MRCIAEADPARFLAATASFRAADPVLTNIITTNATARATGEVPLEQGCRWFHLMDEQGSTTGIAMRIPPRGMAVAAMGDDAIAELVRTAITTGLDLVGCTGPAASAHRFATGYAAATSRTYTVAMPQRILALRAVRHPGGVSGLARPATRADRDLVSRFVRGFYTDTHHVGGSVEDMVDQRLSVPESIWLWETHGTAVSLCWQSAGGGVTRISGVYTPPQHRQHGYAGANVAAVSAWALDRGATACMLFTDANNPTSNKIYEQIGYAFVSDAVELRFS